MWLLLAGASSRAFATEDEPAAPATEAVAPATQTAAPATDAAVPTTDAVAPAPEPGPASVVIPTAGPGPSEGVDLAPPAVLLAPPRFRIADAPSVPGGWQVLDRSDAALASGPLAAAIGDAEALARLRRDRVAARVADLSLVGAGLGLSGGGVYLITLAGPAEETGTRPDPLAYREWTDWRADTDDWEARMDTADRRDEQLWGGVTLLTGAFLAGALVPITGHEAQARAEHPALLWDRTTLLQRLTPTASVSPVQVQLAWVLP